MKRNILKGLLILGVAGGTILGCSKENASGTTSTASVQNTALAVAQTSSQLASGTSFSVQTTSTGSAIDTTTHTNEHPGHCKNDGMGSFLNGTSFLTPTNELIAIVDAENAGDIRGLRMYAQGGATITNYDADGNLVTLPVKGSHGPEGVSFSGGQFPQTDSLLKRIVKTVIDFGSGVSVKHDSITITRAGKILITRSRSGQVLTEIITFENYAVNNNTIEGTKTRINTFDASTGKGSSTSTVANGKITFSDGTVASWASTRQRTTDVAIDSTTHRPSSGTVVTSATTTITSTDGTLIYSHHTPNPITENIACGQSHHWPVSGTVETIYRTQTITIDFGDGSCSNKTISITINGVTTTKTIG